MKFAYPFKIKLSEKTRKIFWIIFALVVIGSPGFLQVLLLELSGDPVRGPDLFEHIVNQEINRLYSSEFTATSGVHTLCVFPENITTFSSGVDSVLLVGVKNKEKSRLRIFGPRAEIYLPNDYQHVVQDLKPQVIDDTDSADIVQPSDTRTWEYKFVVSQYVKVGTYNLVGVISCKIDGKIFKNTFYNGTIEIHDPHAPIRADYLLTWALVLFYVGICVCANSFIKNDITKRAQSLQENSDRRGRKNR